MKAADSRQVNTGEEESGRNSEGALHGAETGVTTRLRTKAEKAQEGGLMEVVCERGNLWLAYDRVIKNKGAAGVDGKRITLDVDSTEITRNGEQEGATRGYNPGKRGRPSHHPLLAFVAEARLVANFWLRPGHCHSANNLLQFLEATRHHLGNTVVGLLRTDSGFFDEAILAALEVRRIPYIVAARLTRPLRRALYQATGWWAQEAGLELTELRYQAEGWKAARRLIVVRQSVNRKTAPGKARACLLTIRIFRDGVTAPSLSEAGRPNRVRLTPVAGFTLKAISAWAKGHLAPTSTVFSDGLACFGAVTEAGCSHRPTVMAGRKPKEVPEFRWINTVLGNLKTSLSGCYHAFDFKKYAARYLAAFSYRFNRRFDLRTLHQRLIIAAASTPPHPMRVIRVADVHC